MQNLLENNESDLTTKRANVLDSETLLELLLIKYCMQTTTTKSELKLKANRFTV